MAEKYNFLTEETLEGKKQEAEGSFSKLSALGRRFQKLRDFFPEDKVPSQWLEESLEHWEEVMAAMKAAGHLR